MPATWNRFTLRDLDVPIGGIFSTGSAIILLRMILEDLLERPQQLNPGLTFYENVIDLAHVFLCWWIVLLFITVIVSAFLKHPLRHTLSAMIIGLPVILTPPLLDAVWSGGKGYWIQYQTDLSQLGWTLLHLPNPFRNIPGIPPGVRIEILLSIVGLAFYGRKVVAAGWVRTISACIGSLAVIVTFGFLPALYHGIGWFDPALSSQNGPAAHHAMLLLPLVLLTAAVFARLVHEGSLAGTVVHRILYPTRLAAYGSAYLAGYALGRFQSTHPLPDPSILEWLRIGTGLGGVWSLFLSTKLLNDIADLAADRISSPDRPLVTGALTIDTTRQLARILWVLSLLLMVAVSPDILLFWLAFAAIAHLYVSEHLNIRKIYPLGQASIAVLIITLVLAGAETAVPNGAATILTRHADLIVGIMTLAFLLANLKDFKDTQGDQICGYQSLPMMVPNWPMAARILSIFIAIDLFVLSIIVALPIFPIAAILILYLAVSLHLLAGDPDPRNMDRLTITGIVAILSCLSVYVLIHIR